MAPRAASLDPRWARESVGEAIRLTDPSVARLSLRGASPAACAFRRLIDVVVGGALLVASAPVLLVATAFVALAGGGSPWLVQRRVGEGGAEFGLWKIRTMRAEAEASTGPTLATRDDERATALGRLLRRARIDELPQLLQVITGTISLVGPRPERPEFVRVFERDVPGYALRHVVKPGVTGLAQVMGSYDTGVDVKLRYDLAYLVHWSPLLDLSILLRTVVTVLRCTGV